MLKNFYNIIIDQGSTYKLYMKYTGTDGNAINLTGFTANFQIKTNAASKKILLNIINENLYVGSDVYGYDPDINAPIKDNGGIYLNVDKNGNSGITGGLLINISAEATQKLISGNHYYELKITNTSGELKKLLLGDIQMKSGATRITRSRPVITSVSSVITDNTVAIQPPVFEYPQPNYSRTKYISPTGSDTTGDGTVAKPYKTLAKAASVLPSGTAQESYIVLLDGTYSLETVGIGNHAFTRVGGSETSLMMAPGFGAGKKITVMAQNLLGAKIIGSITPTLTDDSGVIKQYTIGANYVYTQSGVVRSYFNVRTAEEFLVYSKPFGLTSVLSEEEPYPAMYDSIMTEDYAAWRAQTTKWTIPQTENSLGLIYTEENGNKYISGNAALWSKVSGLGVGFNWNNTALALHGGNNNVFVTEILSVDHTNQRIQVSDFPDLEVWAESEYPADAAALVGNPAFITSTLQYAYQDNIIYFRPLTISNIRVNAISYPFINANTSNVTLCGFEIAEFNTAIGNPSVANSRGTNYTVKYCFVHDVLSIGISISNSYNFNVFGNFVVRSSNRGISVTHPTTAPPSGTTYGGKIEYNTCLFWKDKSGIFASGIQTLEVNNNNCYTDKAAHGNGMAFYSGCKNLTLKNNFVQTPYNIALAISEQGEGSSQWLFDNNYFLGGCQLRDPANAGGWKFTRNVFGSVFYDVETDTLEWWNVYNKIFRNNSLLSFNPVFEFILPINRTGMPASFESEAVAFETDSARNKYNFCTWIQSGESQPNFYNNVSPNRFRYDFIVDNGNSEIVFPYTATNTVKVTEYLDAPPDDAQLRQKWDLTFKDYLNNDYRLKDQYNPNNNIGVTWKGPTAVSANIVSWWLFGLG